MRSLLGASWSRSARAAAVSGLSEALLAALLAGVVNACGDTGGRSASPDGAADVADSGAGDGLDGGDGSSDTAADALPDAPGDPVLDASADTTDETVDGTTDAPAGDVDGTPEDATDLAGDLSPPTHTIGGTATNVVGSAVFLRNNGGDDLPLLEGSGPFTFPTPLAEGDLYAVTAHGVGAEQTCTVDHDTGTVGGADVTDVTVSCVRRLSAVEPLYPTSGADWNDYVANDGGGRLEAHDTPCDNTATGRDACFHGGELRVVPLPWRLNCYGVTAEDSQRAFTWSCTRGSLGVELVSLALKDQVGLGDLIDWSGDPAWRPLSVAVFEDGQQVAQTAESVWWGNEITVANDADSDGQETLSAPGVYAVTADTAAVYLVAAHGVALITAPTATLQGAGGQAAIVRNADVGPHFLWIEVRVDATGHDSGISLQDVALSVLSNLDVSGATVSNVALTGASGTRIRQVLVQGSTSGDGLLLDDSSENDLAFVIGLDNAGAALSLSQSPDNAVRHLTALGNAYGLKVAVSDRSRASHLILHDNTAEGVNLYANVGTQLRDVDVAGSGGHGIELWGDEEGGELDGVVARDNAGSGIALNSAAYDTFRDVVAAHNGGNGIQVSNLSDYNHFTDVTTSDNGMDGLRMDLSAHNVLTGITAVANAVGLRLANSDDNVLADLTLANNDGQGLALISSDGNAVLDAVAANSPTGLLVSSSQYVTGSNLVALGCAVGLSVSSSDHASFHGLLMGGGNTINCSVTGGTAPGITGDCAPADASDFELALVTDPGTVFSGKVGTGGFEDTTEDAANHADDASPGTAAPAAIADWATFENPYRAWGRDGGAFPASDQRGDCTAADSACRIWDWRLAAADATLRDRLALPDGADESDDYLVTHTWAGGTTEDFLRNATELDASGSNGDGLCQGDTEACLFSGGFGSDHGRGNPAFIARFTREGSPLDGARLFRLSDSGRVRDVRDPALSGGADVGMRMAFRDLLVTAVWGDTFYAQDRAGGDYSGLWLFADPDLLAGLRPGSVVSVSGTWSPQLGADSVEAAPEGVVVTGFEADELVPVVASPADLQPGGAAGNALESRLVRVQDVRVARFADPSGSPAGTAEDGFWVTSDPDQDCAGDAPPCALVEDALFDDSDALNDLPAAALGQHFASITGVVDGGKDRYLLNVRYPGDLVPLE